MTSEALLDIDGLHVAFGGGVEAVRGLSLSLAPGRTHGLVGESGCGKTAAALAVMGLLPRGASRRAGRLAFGGVDLATLPERRMAALRGDKLAMIFQEPATSLNPAYTVGSQLTEVLRRHRSAGRAEARERAAALLARVGVNAPALRLGQYPHQLSGGLRQRVMIAMALMCDPALLIADEPTTALDVTVQAQILRLLRDLQAELGLGMLLITHDLGVVARVAHHVSVMYAGEVVETAPAGPLFRHPMHPYTVGLLACVPVPGRVRRGGHLGSIPGTVPRLPPGFAGCPFRSRCPQARAECARPVPLQVAAPGHTFRCILPPSWRGEAAA